MIRFFAIFLVFLSSVASFGRAYSPADVPNVHKADRTQFVANPDGVLSDMAVTRLNAALSKMRHNLTVEPMVVAVNEISSGSPEDFATELFELWGLGKGDLDNGLLILIVADEHAVVLRPGYGLEGALPDITLGRLIREVFIPAASGGDIDEATLSTVAKIDDILSDPATAEEYRSTAADADDRASGEDDEDPFMIYLVFSCTVALFMLFAFLGMLYSVRNKSDYDKYRTFQSWKSIYLIMTAGCMFIPLVATVPLIIFLNRWRNRPRICPNCSVKMKKVDEVHDNDYLTPSQDLEERIGSVDYDVWLCPECGETDILAYILPSSTYQECEKCHARTARPTGYRVVKQPTQYRKGLAVKSYDCLNCHHHRDENIELPVDRSAAIANAAMAGSILGRSGGGFSGGGPVGGGFGGGHTGGGGASGRW